MELPLSTVHAFLRRHRMAPSRFGREFAGDPCLVFDMRAGRVLPPSLAERVYSQMCAFEVARFEERKA
jgi:hypothetical protein